MDIWNATQLVLWVVVLINLFLTYALIRRIGTAGSGGAPPIGGLSSGAAAPDFAAETPDGERLSRGDLGEGTPLVLGFFSPTCVACEQQLPDFGAFVRRAGAAGVRAVAVLDARLEESQTLRASLPEGTTALLAPRAANPLLDSYQVSAYPSYTMVRADGTVDGTYAQLRQLDDRLKSLASRS